MSDEKTIRLLEQLLTAQPGNWEARAHLSELYFRRGEPEKAEHVMTSGGDVPLDEETQLFLGEILSWTDRSRAISHYLGMILKDKKCARAYLALARLYRASGMREEAGRQYRLATVIDESLEDPAFQAWLDGEGPAQVAAPSSSGPQRGKEDAAEEKGDEPIPEASELEELLKAPSVSASVLPRLTFKHVGGMEEVKERIRMSIVYPFKNPALFKKFKKRPGGGILMYGPPGCGKTYLARATAGECEARFLPVGITDVLSKWLGESERRLHELFDLARRRAPTVVFIDELDAMGMSRQNARNSGITTLINQLLTELDGIHASNENVMVLAATNAPWTVDSAMRRPGRFDRVIFVPPPDDAARKAIFAIHLEDVPHEVPAFEKLVKETSHFSGADIRAVVERASEQAIHEEMRTGKSGRVTMKMLLAAIKETAPSTLSWLSTAKNYASYANRGGQYDDLAQFFEREGT